jgi:hypothetical protein
MKNIHILPTEHKSKIGTHKSKNLYFHQNVFTESNFEKNFYLYITSDEKIKEGGYVFWEDKIYTYGEFMKMKTPVYTDYFSIILTTDLDLIKDGIQAIDDEFLEWFVKNTTCDFVELKMIPKCSCGTSGYRYICKSYAYSNVSGDVCAREVLEIPYKIIIPKEEPKQKPNFELPPLPYEYKPEDSLKEAAETHAFNFYEKEDRVIGKQSFIEGAKWQQEQDKNKYSEEDMKQFGLYLGNNLKKLKGKTIDEIFEQFKK